MKKRESKNASKITNQIDKGDGDHVSPQTLSNNRVVPLAQVNSLISGQAPGGLVMGGNKIRKLTNEGSNLLNESGATKKVDIKNLA